MNITINATRHSDNLYKSDTAFGKNDPSESHVTNGRYAAYEDGISISISSDGMRLAASKSLVEGDSTEETVDKNSVVEQEDNNKVEELSESQDNCETCQTSGVVSAEDYRSELEAGDAMAKEVEDMGRIMEIARRISKGDRVLKVDEERLIKFNSKLYQAAKAAAMMHEGEKHKIHKKSVFEEDEENRDKLRELEKDANETSLNETGDATSNDVTVSETIEGDSTVENTTADVSTVDGTSYVSEK